MNELININYTSLANSISNQSLRDCTYRIFSLAEGIRKSSYAVAYLFHFVNDNKLWESDFTSIVEWGEKCFGFKKAQIYNMIRIGAKYVKTIEDTNNNEMFYHSNLIDTGAEYDFSTTQIIAMFPISVDEARELVNEGRITPNMTVREIKDVIKSRVIEAELNDNTPIELDMTVGRNTEDRENNDCSIPDDVHEEINVEMQLSSIADRYLIAALKSRGYTIYDREGKEV